MSLSPLNSTGPSAAALLPTTARTAPSRAEAADTAATAGLASTGAAPAAAIRDTSATKEVSTTEKTAESRQLDQAVADINRFLQPVASSIEFSIDEDSGRTLVQVIDTDTKDVLRQFPSKETLAISQELDRLQGLLIRDKA